MKSTTMLFILLFITSTLSSQYIMVEDEDGDIQYQKVKKTANITFGEPPEFSNCGDIVHYGRVYYGTVQIGDQCWFNENLNYGTWINSSVDQTDNDEIEKYCYDNVPENCAEYGALYQWDEAMQYWGGITGICPIGWHIPTLSDFETLEAVLNDEAKKLVTIGQPTIAFTPTNETGFSALFAGYYYYPNSSFSNLGEYAFFWISTEFGLHANCMYLNYNRSDVTLNHGDKNHGLSVRCLKN